MPSASMNVRTSRYNPNGPSLSIAGSNQSPAFHQLTLTRGAASSSTSGTLSQTGVAVAQVQASAFDAIRAKLDPGSTQCVAQISYVFLAGQKRITDVSVSAAAAFLSPGAP